MAVWADKMEKRQDMSDDCFMMEVETLRCLSDFLEKDAQRTKSLDAMYVQHLLQYALKEFVGDEEVADVKTMAVADEKKKKLGQLMRATCKAEAELEIAAWGTVSLKPLVLDAQKLVTGANTYWLQNAKSELVALTAEVKQVSGGMPGGEVWCSGFTKKTTWDVLSARAEETLLQHAPDSWDAPIASLEQARHVTCYMGEHGTRTGTFEHDCTFVLANSAILASGCEDAENLLIIMICSWAMSILMSRKSSSNPPGP